MKTITLHHDLLNAYTVGQPSVSYEYSLRTRLIPASIADILNSDALLSDRVRITDYNLNNARSYIDFDVFPSSIELTEEPGDKEIYSITFTDSIRNTLRQY